MTDTLHAIIFDSDVFSLTPKGLNELGGAGTTLSTLELKVLVLIDGKSTVAETVARASGLQIGNEGISDVLRKLVDDGLIALAPADEGALEFVDFFDVKGAATPAMLSAAEAKKAAAETTLLLQQRGYFVRIVRRATARRVSDHATPVALVVEDEPVLAGLLRHVLEAEGFSVRSAMNRQEIIDQLRQMPVPDLVLLDVVLPDADGFHVLDRIRQHPRLRTLPVLMLTAKATREAVLRGLTAGADGYITKPFEIPVLLRAVHAVLGLPASAEAGAAKDDVWDP